MLQYLSWLANTGFSGIEIRFAEVFVHSAVAQNEGSTDRPPLLPTVPHV
jgi:hypothetical protein